MFRRLKTDGEYHLCLLQRPVKTLHRYNALGPRAVTLCKGEQHKGSRPKHARVECGVYMKVGVLSHCAGAHVLLQPDISLSVKSPTSDSSRKKRCFIKLTIGSLYPQPLACPTEMRVHKQCSFL